jgi:hypothetical protein
VVAFIIACIAVLPVWRQVKESQRQAAGSAIAPLTNTVETLEKERRIVFDSRQVMSDVPPLVYAYEEGDSFEIYQTWPEKLHAVCAEVDSYREKLQMHVDRHPDTGRNIDNLRRICVKCLAELKEALATMGYAFAQQTTGLSYEEGDEDLSDEVLGSIVKRVNDSMKQFNQIAEQLEIALGEEVPTGWRRIRELERAAIGIKG